ncbi:malto-oligosyltrehalose synthase [Erwinia sp. B116]|nr:malto-oligosyltrehalose synthase [Erwinia sp. B116]PLV63444.1 malto-oligosyltrehalose synthase [Erwinia sp. B116]
MTVPTATYRIQFRNGMTFDRAAGLVPYIKRLGASHLYASPVFTATTDSTHGYDVTDANEIDPAIGGREGFDRLVKALKQAGLGLILDIVPNHMAASLENAWWRDVIEHGAASRYAGYFDIDWTQRLTLPFLGDDFATVLEQGDISVKADPHSGRPALAYFDSFYPLTPASWQGQEAAVLALTDKTQIAALHDRQPWRLMSWRDAPGELSYRRFFEITGLAGVRVEDPAVFADSHRLILELVHSGAVDGLRVDHVDGLADPKGYLEQLRAAAGDACYITVEKILSAGERLPADWPVSGTTGYEFIEALADVLVNGQRIDALRAAYQQQVGQPLKMELELRAARALMVDRNFAGEFATLLSLAVEIAAAEGEAPDDDAIRHALRELLLAFPVYRTYGTAAGLPQADQALLAGVVEQVSHGTHAADPHALGFIVRLLRGEAATRAERADSFRTRFQQLSGPLMAKSVEDTLFFRHSMNLALNEVGAEPLPRRFDPRQFHQAMRERLQQQPDGITSTSTHDTKRGEDARARLYTLSEAPESWAAAVTRWQQLNHNAVQQLADGPAPRPAGEWMLYQALAGVWPAELQPEDADGLQALEERFTAFVEKAMREAKLRTDWAETNDAYEQAVLGYARQLLNPANRAFLQDFHATLQPFIRAGLLNGLTQTVIKLTAPGVPDIYQGSEGLNFSLVDPDNRREPDFNRLQRQLEAGQQPDSISAALLNGQLKQHTADNQPDAIPAALLNGELKQHAADNQPDAIPAALLNGELKQHVVATLLALRNAHPALFRHGDYLPLTVDGPAADRWLAFARSEGETRLVVIVPRLRLNDLYRAEAGDTRCADADDAARPGAGDTSWADKDDLNWAGAGDKRWASAESANGDQQAADDETAVAVTRQASETLTLPPQLAQRRYQNVLTGETSQPGSTIALPASAEPAFIVLVSLNGKIK